MLTKIHEEATVMVTQRARMTVSKFVAKVACTASLARQAIWIIFGAYNRPEE